MGLGPVNHLRLYTPSGYCRLERIPCRYRCQYGKASPLLIPRLGWLGVGS
jgi:hypothetical protein